MRRANESNDGIKNTFDPSNSVLNRLIRRLYKLSFKDKSKTQAGRGLLQGMMESTIVQAKSTAYAEELECNRCPLFVFFYFFFFNF